MNRVPVVVLAGGKAKPEMEAVTGQSNRALAVFQGKTLLSHVIDAFRESDPQNAVCVVGGVPENSAYMRKPDCGSFVANVISGLSAFSEHPFVLITTSDLPFLTGAVISDFMLQSLTRGDFYILCPDNDVTRELDEKRIAWAAGDIIENRPALSRWHPDFGGAFKAWAEKE